MRPIADLRLPGIYFSPPRQSAGVGLPPLDVAGFVGFAERGPLDLPVPVEELKTYSAVFGGELPLAQESGGRTVYANLPRAVEGFFANHGRRCYVVRVAGHKATAARFYVPGLVGLAGSGRARLVSISASSPGSWAADLRLGTRLQTTSLPTTVFRVIDSHRLEWMTGGAPQAIRNGDLLRLTFTDRQQCFFPVTEVKRLPNATPHMPLTLVTQNAWHLTPQVEVSPPLTVQAIFRLTTEGADPLIMDGQLLFEGGKLSLFMTGDGVGTVQRSDVLRLELSDGSTHLFPVAELQPVYGRASPPVLQAVVRADYMISLSEHFLLEKSPPPVLAQVERLRFDLLLRQREQRRPTLSDLAFNAGHPRFWGEMTLLESSVLYRQGATDADGARAADATRLFREMKNYKRSEDARNGRLDIEVLAALLAPVDDDEKLTYLPLDMPAVVTGGEELTGPTNAGDDNLDVFDQGLSAERFPDTPGSVFLDDYLVPDPLNPSTAESARTLREAAFDRYYVQNRRLRGLHSLLFIDEVALVCVPDAVHRKWEPSGEQEPVQPAQPQPAAPLPPPCPPQGAPFAYCHTPPQLLAVDPASGSISEDTIVVLTGTDFTTEADTTVQFGRKAASSVQVISATMLRCTAPAGVAAGAVTVEIANRNGSGSKPDAFTYLPSSTPRQLPVLEPAKKFQNAPLLAIQQAVITMCQARRDVVGILTLPLHFGKRECIEWQEDLRQRLRLPRRRSVFNDVRDIADLSYVAVYHPWLLVADANAPDGLRSIPCDGAVCGMIAARERQRQVWVAPANAPMQGVLGLIPEFSTDEWADLFNLQFNLVRSEPRDFRVMSAHTLSDERNLLQVSVRRLMILLRKIAIERGMDFVFESNHERFREGVRVMLEDLLQFMFERGAFSGAAADQAFRVLTDVSINTPQSVEQGRFIAQIQVAPSQPTEFITVLLTRIREGALQATEV